mmetsp:Transcript_7856/g.31113  ORF Transcript_7856/g.31113 Transcript_7856/m.31113 type:complete len:353 (+) Transcript_7856:1188-2246(+)
MDGPREATSGGGLPHHDEIHRAENTEISALLQVDSSLEEHGVNRLSTLGCEANELKHTSHDVCEVSSPTSGLHGSLPRYTTSGGAIEGVLNLEASLLSGSDALFNGANLRECISLGDTIYNIHMNLVVLVVLRSAQPFVRREESARFENMENLLVQSSSVGCVASCLDGVRAVEGVRLENLAEVHEVTLHNLRKIRHSGLLVEFLASSDLVLVDGDPGNVPTSGLDDVAHGTSHAAADVKRLHAGFQADGLRDGGLLADNACLEALADFTSREVKALSPAVLIKVGDERVKLVDEVWGAEDPIADTLAVLLIEELIVGVYAGVDEVLSHRAGLPGENIERVLSEPGVFHGEI